jgi:glutamate---cysteine ligase / carboxylate-amine ligase
LYRYGVEEEYQLVDPATGALRSRARDVLDWDWADEIRPEVHETTLEIGTRVCANAGEMTAELARLRFHVGTAAAAEGFEIAAAGLHPFSRWEGHRRSEGERYRAIEDRYGRLVRDEHIFGMHVHVEVPPERRLELLRICRHYVPHILALSASSPFLEGEDTGYASFRSILWRRWPMAGVPPDLASEAEYRELLTALKAAGAVQDDRTLYWSLRPHPVYPTLEFRVADVCPRLEDAVAIAALVRALVATAADGELSVPWREGAPRPLDEVLLRSSEWLAARYGLAAQILPMEPGAAPVPVAAAIRGLVERVRARAEAMGDGEALAGVEQLLRRGNGADRLRREYREAGGMLPVMHWLIAETMLGTGLDRRAGQRTAAP